MNEKVNPILEYFLKCLAVTAVAIWFPLIGSAVSILVWSWYIPTAVKEYKRQQYVKRMNEIAAKEYDAWLKKKQEDEAKWKADQEEFERRLKERGERIMAERKAREEEIKRRREEEKKKQAEFEASLRKKLGIPDPK